MADSLADTVRGAFDWIDSVAVAVDGGQGWLEGGELFDDLYSGTAGVLLGCAEAAAAGFDPVRVAAGARGRLLHLAEPGAATTTMPDDGVFSGWAGVALALRAWRYAGAVAREHARPAMLALLVTVFPFNTHLAFYSTFWGGFTLLLAALYAGSLLSREPAPVAATQR